MSGSEQPAGRPSKRAWWRPDPARRARAQAARSLYELIVKKGRTPAFFTVLGIPDTTEGRFEVIALHAALVMRRLKAEGEPGKALAQDLFDLMFQDVDMSLRELGVGDMSVGKYVKRFARQFYARIEILEATLVDDDRERLRPFLASNVWRGGEPPPGDAVERLIDYLQRWLSALDLVGGDDLLRGAPGFGPLPEVGDGPISPSG